MKFKIKTATFLRNYKLQYTHFENKTDILST